MHPVHPLATPMRAAGSIQPSVGGHDCYALACCDVTGICGILLFN